MRHKIEYHIEERINEGDWDSAYNAHQPCEVSFSSRRKAFSQLCKLQKRAAKEYSIDEDDDKFEYRIVKVDIWFEKTILSQ